MKPLVIVDPLPRQRKLVFTDAQWARLNDLAEIVLHEGERMPAEMLDRHLPEAVAIIGQSDMSAERIARAPKLKAIINIEGNFLPNVDYDACVARGVHALVVAPVFAAPVAEASLGMAIDLARGLTLYDRAMRSGDEEYGLLGNRESFLLAGKTFGLIGFGNLGRALLPLLRPFNGPVLIHDPWLPDSYIRDQHAEPCALDALLSEARVIFVLAGVTVENQGFLDRAKLSLIRRDAVLVLASRAAVVDFDALIDLVDSGAFRAGTDVFPVEPVAKDHRVRRSRLVLSSHRFGGMPETFAAMGEMVVDDLALILRGLPPVRLQRAQRETASRFRSLPGRSYEKGVSL
jgi:phosphoglycerate dehydrogenase-like enzyme